MRTVNSKTLTSLALLETSLISSDYLSTFFPFLSTLILKKKYKEIEISIIVKDFSDEFGIYIPRAPMHSILAKAVTNNLIEQLQDGIYVPVMSEILKYSFLTEQDSSSKKILTLLKSFIEYVAFNHKDEPAISMDEAIDIFIGFLDEYSPRAISGEENVIEQYSSNRNLYLMGAFIQFMAQSNLDLFDTIRRLAMAYLITTALTYDVKVEKREKEFEGVTLYLDAPVVLRLLGLHTEELEVAYIEMFQTFKDEIGATFMVFQHTLEEISGIIDDCIKWIDNIQYNPAYANPALLNFVKRKFSKTQVELFKSKIEEKVKELGIDMDADEYYNILSQDVQIDENILRNKLIETYKIKNPQYNAIKNKNSLDYDIRSINNIAKLWGNKSSYKYSSLKYIFLTNNSSLAYVCREYISEYWWESKKHKSPCITDYFLGTMIWLSTPAENVENVSKLKLLADCSAATTLSREIMEKFSDTLKKLQADGKIEPNDYLLLRKAGYEKNFLQNRTLNEESAFDDTIIEQVLEDIKYEIQKPLYETICEKDTEIGNLQIEKNEKEKKLLLFQKEKQDEKVKKNEEINKIEEMTTKFANRFISTYMPIVIATFACIATILQLLPQFSKWAIAIKVIAAIISLISAVLLGCMKSNLFKMHNKLIAKIRKYYQIKIFKEKLM